MGFKAQYEEKKKQNSSTTFKGVKYYAMIAVEDADKEECEYTILKTVIEDGEENLITIEDDDEFDDIADYFDDIFATDIDYDQ